MMDGPVNVTPFSTISGLSLVMSVLVLDVVASFR